MHEKNEIFEKNNRYEPDSTGSNRGGLEPGPKSGPKADPLHNPDRNKP